MLGIACRPYRNLSLELCDLDLEHANLLLHLPHGHLALPQRRVVDVALLVQDAQLVVAVNELNTSVVTCIHSSLEGVERGEVSGQRNVGVWVWGLAG